MHGTQEACEILESLLFLGTLSSPVGLEERECWNAQKFL